MLLQDVSIAKNTMAPGIGKEDDSPNSQNGLTSTKILFHAFPETGWSQRQYPTAYAYIRPVNDSDLIP